MRTTRTTARNGSSQAPNAFHAEAVIDLPAPLLLHADLLGLRKPAVIGGVDVHVVLPGFDSSEHETVLPGDSKAGWLDWYVEKLSDEEDPYWPFGRDFPESDEFGVNRLLVLPDGPLERGQAQRLKEKAEDWVQRLTTWIEVVAREDLFKQRVVIDEPGRGVEVWLDDPSPSGEHLKSKKSIKFEFGGRLDDVTPEAWASMLSKTSDDTPPPEAHLLLRDARHAANTGQFRRSVLDASTATELALTWLRDRRISRADADLRKHLEGVRQISNLVDFLNKTNVNLPSRVKDEVGTPRNQAIHGGSEPSEKTASAAVAKAEEVVELGFPRSDLLS